MQFKVALLQMEAAGFDQAANAAKGEAFCRRAAQMGADLALFPEMWNIGYGFYEPGSAESLAAWQAQAVPPDGAYVRQFQALAAELGMAIAVTYLEKTDAAPRNTVSLIDRFGKLLFSYAKVHTCDFDVERALQPGEEFFTATLDTVGGAVQVGAMICYDREFPEAARILMLQGAEIILVPNACEMEQNRTEQLRVRAFENMVGAALANYASPAEKGHSVAFDPIAFDEKEGTRDTLLVRAGEAEGIHLAVFDMDAIRAYRQRETWGNAFRRPRLYGLLTAEEVKEPFKRPEARRK